jgi:hypothetical protein
LIKRFLEGIQGPGYAIFVIQAAGMFLAIGGKTLAAYINSISGIVNII